MRTITRLRERQSMDELELWGGAECTVNRVGDRYFDQLDLSDWGRSGGDLGIFAALGIKRFRCPLLWEQISPDTPDECDWSAADRRLEQLARSGIQAIAGLVHHGSGPRYTSLVDDGFAAGLAAHARRVAERHQWIEDWTPVNEPLTTARFAALYGLWYPHHRDERSFWLALLNQIDGVRLSMREIRRVIPGARLVQTEDLGRTYSTAALRRQAAFDNVRRWMSWDLLCGRVETGHPLHERLVGFGFGDRLRAMADEPCTPDIIGINHYLTSDRFLDHRLSRYPASARGGNGRERYADVEAVRVLDPAPQGLADAIRDAWARYRLPIAITESHNGCTREEQMRWTAEGWGTAQALRDEGIAVRAVTAWSLLGSHGWNQLLTDPEAGHYESGAYDMRGGAPRPTAIAEMLKSLAQGSALPPPVLAGAGWWRRAVRLHYPAASHAAPAARWRTMASASRPPVLITGRTGTLGRAIARACELRDIPYLLTARTQLALEDGAAIARTLDEHRPWAVINAAGWVRVDDAEEEPDACMRANRHGAVALARACADRDIPVVNFSSDLVFDGALERPYGERDSTAPLCVYGRSKAEADRELLSLDSRLLIVRTAAFFSPDDPYNFAAAVVRALREGRPFLAADDYLVSPTYVPDLVRVTLDLLIDDARGLWHVSSGEGLSWAEFGRRVATALHLDAELVELAPGATLGWRAPRPRQSALTTERGQLMPALDCAIAHFADVAAERSMADIDL